MFRNSSKSGRQERAAARWGMGAVKLYVFVNSAVFFGGVTFGMITALNY